MYFLMKRKGLYFDETQEVFAKEIRNMLTI